MDTNLKTVPGVEAPKPSEAEVGQALAEIEQASAVAPAKTGPEPPSAVPAQSWFSRRLPILCFLALALVFLATILWLAHRTINQFQTDNAAQVGGITGRSTRGSTNSALQAEAEQSLAQLVAGNPGVADRLMAESGNWTGKTKRTPKTDQLITVGITLKDMRAREAALQAQLALDGIPLDQSGFDMLERSSGNPQQRTWALWMMGALGNRGVDPVHAAKVIDSYLANPDASVRASAVEGLALIGTDETIPMLLDRFRNDPSLPVQEQAICGLADAGMYTHAQRMVVAASLVGWLDDSTLSQQQRAWDVQALGDISGRNLGADAKAWRQWYDASH
jgi:hypothetical protein